MLGRASLGAAFTPTGAPPWHHFDLLPLPQGTRPQRPRFASSEGRQTASEAPRHPLLSRLSSLEDREANGCLKMIDDCTSQPVHSIGGIFCDCESKRETMKQLTHRPHDGSRVPCDVVLLALIDHDLCRDVGEVRVQGSDGEDHRTTRKLPKGELGCSARSCVHARMMSRKVTRPSNVDVEGDLRCRNHDRSEPPSV